MKALECIIDLLGLRGIISDVLDIFSILNLSLNTKRFWTPSQKSVFMRHANLKIQYLLDGKHYKDD